MKKYNVTLDYIRNEDYYIESNLQEFQVSANNTDEAIEIVKNKLSNHMLNDDDFEAICYSNGNADITFGDSDTGQDVCYEIIEL